MWNYILEVLKAFQEVSEAGLCPLLPVIPSPVSLLYTTGNSCRFTPKQLRQGLCPFLCLVEFLDPFSFFCDTTGYVLKFKKYE